MSDEGPCERCAPLFQKLSDEHVGLLATTRSQAAKIGQLSRTSDPMERARKSEHWPVISNLFQFWARESGHKRAKLDIKRFRMAQGRLNEEGGNDDMLLMALEGVIHRPWRAPDGDVKNWWEDALQDRRSFERSANKGAEHRKRRNGA